MISYLLCYFLLNLTGFLTGILLSFARKFTCPIDQLSFQFNILATYYNQESPSKSMKSLGPSPKLNSDREGIPENGVVIHGLFMEGFRWNDDTRLMDNPLPDQMICPLPMMHIEPVLDYKPADILYAAPLYKTSARGGDSYLFK